MFFRERFCICISFIYRLLLLFSVKRFCLHLFGVFCELLVTQLNSATRNISKANGADPKHPPSPIRFSFSKSCSVLVCANPEYTFICVYNSNENPDHISIFLDTSALKFDLVFNKCPELCSSARVNKKLIFINFAFLCLKFFKLKKSI